MKHAGFGARPGSKPSIFLASDNKENGRAVIDLIFELSSYAHSTFRGCLSIEDKEIDRRIASRLDAIDIESKGICCGELSDAMFCHLWGDLAAQGCLDGSSSSGVIGVENEVQCALCGHGLIVVAEGEHFHLEMGSKMVVLATLKVGFIRGIRE
jgi:hypothetical protein